MKFSSFKWSALSSCLLLLSACSQHSVSQAPQNSQSLSSVEIPIDQPMAAKLQLREVDMNGAKTEDVQWLTLSAWPEVAALLSSKIKGYKF